MSGAFDFDNEAEPAPKERGGKQSAPATRRGYSPATRRELGRASLSIGGFVTIGGGLLAFVSLVLPAGWGDATVSDIRYSRRVWIWALGAIAVGGAFLRVRRVRFPAAGDYILAGAGVGLGLVFAAFLAICGYVIIDETGLKGIGTMALCFSGLTVAGGAILRFIEQAVKWGKEEIPETRTDRDQEDDEPRPRRRQPKREDEEDEPRPKRRRPERGEEEDEEPKPNPKPKAQPKPAPKAKPKPKSDALDLPDE